MLTAIWSDLTYAARSLAKARAFTVVCVLSLGIGMAPVIAVPYAAGIAAVPPPGVNADGLVQVITTPRGGKEATPAWSYPDFLDLRDAPTGIVMTGWIGGESKVEVGSATSLFVSRNYFPTIGVTLMRGPGFGEADAPEVILGHGFWQRRRQADPAIVGKSLVVDGVPHLVVGIAPNNFGGHLRFQENDLYLPLERHPRLADGANANGNARTDRGITWVAIHGRLSPGVSVAQASASVSALTARLAEQYPATNENRVGIAEEYFASGNFLRPQLTILQAIALTVTGMVLLIVCLNISGMVQVRSAMRERELSIRQAIGATRRHLMRFLLAEAVILAGLGAMLACFVLFNIPSILVWLSDEPLPVQVQNALGLDLRMVLVCVGLCLVTSLAFGLLPAARFSRPSILPALKDDAGVGGPRVGRAHRVGAALQIAIAVPLIVMSGISLDRVRATAVSDLGFAAELLYAVPLELDPAAKDTAEFRLRNVRDNLAKANGVASVTLADGLPLDFRYRTMRVALQSGADVAPRFVQVHVTRIGDGYMDTMGIPLLRGRGLTVDDRAGAAKVTVISKALAEQLFPSADAGDAVGKQLTLGSEQQDDRFANVDQGRELTQTLTIVGVTGDFPTSQMSTEREQLLLPLAQHSAANVFLVARSAPGEAPMKLTAALENAAREFDPNTRRFGTTDGVGYPTVVTGVWLRKNSMHDFLGQSAAGAMAGGVVLILAALGIYGVVGLMVATRTREIAVRSALGATRGRVLGMILFDVVKLTMPGVVVGLILSVALIRLNAENMGVSLSSVENMAYVAGAAVAVLVAVLASLAPARRAASVQPMVAMRST
jgi:putative ABC transport system permease protein